MKVKIDTGAEATRQELRRLMPLARFPRWVYGHGSDPDPRFSLANERTFLAGIRTSLALFAAGAALEALNLPISASLRAVAAGTFVAIGIVAAVQSWLGWATTERALRKATTLPGPSLAPLITVGVVLAIAVVAVGLLR